MIRRLSLFAFSALLVTRIYAVSAGFGLDAFNRSISAATKGNAVFSPAAFDFDCVIFSEAFDPLVRANYAEKMGVLNGLTSVYQPMYDRLTTAQDKGLDFFMACAFFVPDDKKVHIAYRKWLQDTFSAEVHQADRTKGSVCWFRAKMNGYMEDFTLPSNIVKEKSYSFFNLVTLRCAWQEPFSTNNTRDIKFKIDESETRTVTALCDVRVADVWERKRDMVLRLPLKDNAWFFAILPNDGLAFRDARNALTSLTLVDYISSMNSAADSGLFHGPTALVIPRIDIETESDLKLPFSYYRLHLSGMTRMPSDVQPKLVRQRVRFVLDEKCAVCEPMGEKNEKDQIHATTETKKVVLSRPFLFFVYHEPTATIPISGQFTGR